LNPKIPAKQEEFNFAKVMKLNEDIGMMGEIVGISLK